MSEQGRRLREVGENPLVARLRALAGERPGEAVVVGPGDDTAALRAPVDRLLLFTCDMMVEGTHFRRDWATPEQIGWKAMAQNLSDIAAMGGQPLAALCSLGAPGEMEQAALEGISRGLVAAASKYGAALVGGDLVGSRLGLVVDVALVGWVEPELLLRRRGARPGDAILVTGHLGASGAGLAALVAGIQEEGDPDLQAALQAHHQPRPRLLEGRAIARTRRATAMMDLSDGIADDLPRLCAESGVGAWVEASRIPVAPCCHALAGRLNQDPLDWALQGGEDYELLFTCSPDAVGEIAAAVAAAGGVPISCIGTIIDVEDVGLVDSEGRERPLGTGFAHFGPTGQEGAD